MRYDVIVIGGDAKASELALKALEAGRTCCLISPAVGPDMEIRQAFVRKGGVLLYGDSVESSVIENNEVKGLCTKNLGSDMLVAKTYCLCSGRFFTGGLKSDMSRVYEPLFSLDVKFDPDRSKWCEDDFFAPQPFNSFGVEVDSEGHPSVGKTPIVNLFATGSILADGADNFESVCRSISAA